MFYQQVIARRYARGLLLSLAEQSLDEVLTQLNWFIVVIDSSPELKRLFEDPAFSPLERSKIINKLAVPSNMNDDLRHFLLLLVEKNRLKLLPLINEALLILVDSKKERVRVKITSASALNNEDLEDITKNLEASLKKQVLAEVSVDPSLLGGLCVQVGGTLFDGSLKAKLQSLRHQLELK